MLPYNVRKLNQGFTLVEMLVTVIILGVIAAIGTPSVLGVMARNQANSALSEIESAMKEAQKLAIRNGSACTVNITAATRTVTGNNVAGNNCLLRDRVFPNAVILRSGDQNITFSGKGNTTNGITVEVGVVNTPSIRRCLTVATGLGIMRTGDLDGSDNCIPRN